MNDTKNLYEFVLVVSVKIGEKTDELIEKFKTLIESNTELKDVNKWGKRKLAYPIKKEAEGENVVFEFVSDSKFPQELDRISQITEGVLRSLIVKKA